MPCYDGRCDTGPSYHDDYVQEKLAKEFAESIACAILTVLENQVTEGKGVLDMINYQEAGFKRIQLERWWAKHKKLDCERRIREKKERDRKAREALKKAEAAKVREAALAKLTPAECKALGLK